MNKVLLVGRLVRDPETRETTSGIKYTRFTVAVTRPFGEDQADFIPIVAWRNQADFVAQYMRKGSQISVEGRFASSTYQNNDNQTITRYEVSADRVAALETRAQVAARLEDNQLNSKPSGASLKKEVQFTKEQQVATEDTSKDIPWELEL